jgi:hypothetical protein
MSGKLFYSVNENFFKTWNSRMAYILGLTFADGSLYKTSISWEVQKKDKEILEKINSAMNSNYPIKLTERKKYIRLRISNPTIASDLKKFGFLLKKNERKFPNVPTAFLRDFIRGILDGDGWVVIREKKREVCIGFVSGNYEFLKELTNKLNEKLNLSVNNLRCSKRITKKGKVSRIYEIEWYARNAFKIIKFLYNELSENDLFLNRKFIKQLKARKILEKIKRYTTKKDVEEKFGVSIKTILMRLLYEKKLKVVQIAKKLGVRSSTIYEWIKGSKIKLPKRKKFFIGKCLICGKRFRKYNASQKYCSIICANISRRTGKMVNCVVCNKQIYRPAWWFKVNKYPLCSRECQKNWKRIILEKGILVRSKSTGRFLRLIKLKY